MAPPKLLEEFPGEIIDHILQYLPKDTLAMLRLESRVFQERAPRFLYRQFTLRYSVTSAAKAREIIKRPEFAGLVREYRLEVNPSAWVCQADYSWDIVMHLIVSQYSAYSASDDTYQKVDRVIQELFFDRLNSISMTFGVAMNAELTISSIYAREMFSLAISLLRTHLSSRSAPPELDSLSIENLPCEYEMIQYDGISKYLRNLRRLEIDTTTLEDDQNSPYDSQTYTGAMDFYARFPQVFLAPASPNLRVLCLSADAPWGWYPKIDLRGIHFPYLESLTLSRFTFSHNWQIFWLSDHADTLKRLNLIECAILCHATSTCQNFDRRGYPQDYEYFNRRTTIRGSYQHNTRWSDYFVTFARCLPRLQSFSLVAPDQVIRDAHRQLVPDEEKEACCVHDRYLKYTSLCYTPACTCIEWSAEEHRWTEHDEQDGLALRVLLEVIRWRKSHEQIDIPVIRPNDAPLPTCHAAELVRRIVNNEK